VTVWVNVSGDFASGLIVHLDYTATDADENTVAGPYEADMNIFDAGEDTPPECTPADFSLSIVAWDPAPHPGEYFLVDLLAQPADEESTFTVEQFTESMSIRAASDVAPGAPFDPTPVTYDAGEMSNTSGLVRFGVIVGVSGLALPGDEITIDGHFAWASCDGTPGEVDGSLTIGVSREVSGSAHTATYWRQQLDRADKGKDKLDYSTEQLTQFLQIVALHSGIFTYSPWDGTDPFGGPDDGFVEIGSYADAAKALKGPADDSKKVKHAESEDLALWLNVAAGALNPDTPLKILPASEKGHDDDQESDSGHGKDQDKSAFEKHFGSSTLPSDEDSVDEILAFAAAQITDWADDHGGSQKDLQLSRGLCMAVNHGWLVPA
jgi:hypothetical protein